MEGPGHSALRSIPPPHGWSVIQGLLVLLVLGANPGGAVAAPPVPVHGEAPAWAPPFDAELKVDAAHVRQRPEMKSPITGLIRRDSRFRVTGCAPSCKAPGAWALLGDQGAVRLSLLAMAKPGTAALEDAPEFIYAKVLRAGADVRAAPDGLARRMKHEAAGRVLAFTQDEALLARGWLARPGGGFVSTKQVLIHQPSLFQGEERPSTPLAFLMKPTLLTSDAGTAPPGTLMDGGAPLPAFSRIPLLEVTGRTVRVPGGTLPRGAVRLAFPRQRPRSIPDGARWVHVDLTEQVLTAYEGDTWVYATLVSTGKQGKATHRGIFRVWSKTLHEVMAEENEYFVEEVPYTQYFYDGEALHGAFWHSGFGTPVSHGCVNLSLPDARWLFRWAPPMLPSGWHSYRVLPGTESLWVVVEHAKPGELPTSTPVPEAHSAW